MRRTSQSDLAQGVEHAPGAVARLRSAAARGSSRFRRKPTNIFRW
jgi:hypothetical protein